MDDANTKMPEKRKLEIESLLQKEKVVTINKISELFKVSYLTARKDIEKLEKEGIVRKVHGGAILNERFEPEAVFEKQKGLFKDEKDRIAREASKRIKDGDFIILESGSTGLELVKYLKNFKNIKVATAGIPILIELWELSKSNKDIETYACGGLIRPEVSTFVGSHAMDFFREVNVDLAFVGALAVSTDKGISTATYFDADIHRAIIKSAKKVILLCDSSKFETYSYINVTPLSKIDEIITDSGIKKEALKKLEKSKLKVTIV